jgi:PIN domain nuclease of toxin-antitoxin system
VIYVTDTHPLVYWAANRKSRLGRRARRIFQQVDQGKHSIVVPMAVLEEVSRLVEKKAVRLAVPFRCWAEELDRSANFQVHPYTIDILFEWIALTAIRDSADRAIVAAARHLRCPLITADAVIHDGNWVETVWD